VFSNRHFAELAKTPCVIAGVVDLPSASRVSTNTAAGGAESFVDAARGRGIPVFTPVTPNTAECVSAIQELSPDIYIAVGYLNILGERLLSLPSLVAANFHASLLPAYRGKHPVFWALRNGERWSGVTVHAMDPKVDCGDIILQLRIPTRTADSVSSLYARIIERSVGLVHRLVDCAERRDIPRRAQSREGSSYFSSTTENDFRLEWSRETETLRRWITVSPGACFCETRGQRIFFQDATAARPSAASAPGTIAGITRVRCVISTGDGALSVRRARIDTGAVMNAHNAMRSLGLDEGDRIA